MNESIFISAVILAAGESKRMGSPKLLMTWNDKTIIEETVDNYTGSAVNETIVVIGNKAQEIEKVLGERDVILVTNPRYTKGMSSSIITGVEFVNANARGIMLALADQPEVTSKTINKLIGTFSRLDKGIIVPVYDGERGNPVIFDTKYKKELLALKGDKGGRDIVNLHPEDVSEVLADESVKADIDTPEDYKNQREKLDKSTD